MANHDLEQVNHGDWLDWNIIQHNAESTINSWTLVTLMPSDSWICQHPTYPPIMGLRIHRNVSLSTSDKHDG